MSRVEIYLLYTLFINTIQVALQVGGIHYNRSYDKVADGV
jgi:hypothetical protein